MVWTVPNNIDADPFHLDQQAYLSIPLKAILIKVFWISNSLDIQVWTRLSFTLYKTDFILDGRLFDAAY